MEEPTPWGVIKTRFQAMDGLERMDFRHNTSEVNGKLRVLPVPMWKQMALKRSKPGIVVPVVQ
jgi:hypothetical protein